jgi:hypothetical protein
MSSEGWSYARRLDVALCPITNANLVFSQHRSPLHNGVKNPTVSGYKRSGLESHGYAIPGLQELLVPRMAVELD